MSDWYEPKTPLGLIPRWIRDEHRLVEIDAAIERYVAALWPIPSEWMDERDDLLSRLALR